MSSTLRVEWDDVMTGVKQIASTLPFRPTTLVGIGRGGLPVLTAMASYLDIQRVGVVLLSVRASGKPFARRVSPSAPVALLPPEVEGESVLIIDDIVRSGVSMKLAQLTFRERASSRLETAALFAHEGAPVDYHFALVGSRTWVEFPWDRWGDV